MRILVAFTFGLILLSCVSEQPDFLIEGEPIVVNFDYQIEGDCSTPVLEVVLENKTLTADSYLWDFGDGTISNQVNPRKVYPRSGSYTIKLTAYFSEDTVQIEKQVSISRNSDGTGPSGQLSFARSNATNLEFTFAITTDEPSYLLDFGDGNTPIISSGEKSIKHQYAAPGRYSAGLFLQNSEGSNCVSVLVDVVP
jgi:PKD repeat protein